MSDSILINSDFTLTRVGSDTPFHMSLRALTHGLLTVLLLILTFPYFAFLEFYELPKSIDNM